MTKISTHKIEIKLSSHLCQPKAKMDPPQTKKQQHKGKGEKRGGHGKLHSGKGTRALEANQEKRKK